MPTIPHVADIAARLALTGLSVGYQCVQDDAVAMVVTGSLQDGIYLSGNGYNYPMLGGTNEQLAVGYGAGGYRWEMRDADNTLLEYGPVPSPSAPPNLATAWYDGDGSPRPSTVVTSRVLTYQYNGPDPTVVGYFVSGGTQDGIYQDLYDGAFTLLGTSPGDHAHSSQIARGVSYAWDIFGPSGEDGDSLYRSFDDVATPDLCTWYDAEGNEAPITVTPVTRGELDAACRYNALVLPRTAGVSSGRSTYESLTDGTPVAYNDGLGWNQESDPSGVGNTAFPWDAEWSGNSPVPVVTRWDNVEANWAVV